MWASAHRRMLEYEQANPGCTDADKVKAVQQEEMDIFDEVLQARKGSEVRGLGRIGKRSRSSGSNSASGSASQATSRRQPSASESEQLAAAMSQIRSQQDEIKKLKKKCSNYDKYFPELLAKSGIPLHASDEEEEEDDDDDDLPQYGSPRLGTSSGGMTFMPTPGFPQQPDDDED